ncbi:MAG: hypothetical protein ACRD5L_14370, partial [Bryobacteraceae bacterium]
MPTLSASESRFLTAVSGLAYCNPFLPDRIEWERSALGREFAGNEPVWSVSVGAPDAVRANVALIHKKLEAMIENLHQRLSAAPDIRGEELVTYEESIHYLLYQRFALHQVPYRTFLADWNRLCHFPGKTFKSALEPAHVYACFRQIARAFHHIYDNIIGNSIPAAGLRASTWQSIFTHDMRRYRTVLYRKMTEFPTLITGPS